MPAWSADGKTIAYVADADGVRQVFTRSISSSQRAQITHSLFDCRDPFWARDGSRIFYISNAAEGYGVWSVGAAGGPAESVIRNADSAALSPDGHTLAILRSDERDTYLQLWLSSPPEAEPKRYAREPFATQQFSDAFMRFAPDSSKLAVWARTWQSGVPGPKLWIVPVGDIPPHLVADVPEVLSTNNPPRFDWLADNRRIVAGVERSAVQGVHLWVVDTQSGDMRPLTSGAGGENTPAVSPDGRRIAYATQDTNFDLIEVPVDGSSPRQLLATSRNESEPGWSPVSAQYAFVTDRNGRPEIWLRSRDGAWERPLVTDESFAHEVTHTFRLPVFSPDGQRIAFERVTNTGAVLWIATLAGGPPVQATKGEPGLFISNYSPTWSPDGEWIAFVDVRPGKWSLAKVRVGTGSHPQILHDVTGLAHSRNSPGTRCASGPGPGAGRDHRCGMGNVV